MTSSKHHSRDKLKHLGKKVTIHFSLSPSTLSNPGTRFYSEISTNLSIFPRITPSQHYQLPNIAKPSRFATKAHLSRLMPILLNSNSPPRKHHEHSGCTADLSPAGRAANSLGRRLPGTGAFRILTALHDAALAALAENAMCNKSEIEWCGAWLGRFKFVGCGKRDRYIRLVPWLSDIGPS
jgi:hypothetical protein